MRLRWLVGLLLLLAPTLVPTTASATLLYAGGEDSDFICSSSGTCATYTNSAGYRSSWARESYQVRGANADPPSNRFATAQFTASSTLWLHARYCTFDDGNYCRSESSGGYQLLRIMDSAGNPTLVVKGTGTSNQVVISSRTSGGSFTDLVTCSSAFSNSLTQLDFYVNYGTSGEVALYTNGTQVCDYTGNVTNGDGASTLNQIEFSAVADVDSSRGAWSEVIVATTDTRSMSRFSAYTVADGNTTGFTGTNICSSIWNAAAFNDANFGYASTSGVTHECTVNGTIPSGSYSVVGLVMNARALVGGSGPQHFNFVTRTGGTDYTSSDYAPGLTFSNIGNYIQTTNPATSSAWSVSDFSASGFNVGEKTTP